MELKQYEIIDNFVDLKLFQEIKNYLLDEHTPWYLKKEDTINSNNKNGFFSSCYYNNSKPNNPLFYTHVVPILEKLNAFSVLQVRANLTFRDKDCISSDWHTDHNSPLGTTSILFFTNCNSKTQLQLGEKIINVDSVENRLIKFKSLIKHKVIYQDDVHRRLVLNLNYITINGEI